MYMSKSIPAVHRQSVPSCHCTELGDNLCCIGHADMVAEYHVH